ncbi:MAG TPA: lipoate--protein ligase family protein [Candidatus Thermoplasmatota archaeon]|nr:lipoate--protein ligase family protein [Candidatus Thermoplasmatota archaeon]
MKLLLDGHLTGAENMARDEALLAAGEPVVRLYGWRPAAVSLGRSQGEELVIPPDLAARYGVDVVPRSTGGGAILHNEDEITYCVVVPLDFPGLPRDLPGSFRHLSRGVLLAVQRLGLPATFETGEGDRDALCYLRRQGTHVMVNGRKISGGAQRRTATHVLQHGTLLVTRDVERMAALFQVPQEAIDKKVVSLQDLGVQVPREKLLELVAEGFREALGVRWD